MPSVTSASQITDFNDCEKRTEIVRKFKCQTKWDDKYKLFGTKGHAYNEKTEEPDDERFKPYHSAFMDWLDAHDDEIGETEIQFGRLSSDPPEVKECNFRGYNLIGFVDGITKKRRIMYDHKFTSDPRLIKLGWQDKIYMCIADELGWDVDTSEFHYLIYKRDKQFNYVSFEDRPFRTGDLDYWKDRLEAQLKRHKEAWETGIFVPNLSSCSGCRQKEFCSVHGGSY